MAEAACSSDAAVFVVGVPRSGTTLLASLLSSHSALAAGPETAFFASLAAAGGERVVDSGSWPESAVEFLAASRLEGESLLERYDLDRSRAADLLRPADPSVATVLALLGEAAASATGKRRWVEKSPVHLQYVREIRRHFPRAPIVRIVRDPRDVALSLAAVPWGPDDMTAGLLYWRRFHERSRNFFASDPASFTVRYEELVERPEAILRELCGFLGESFEPAMLTEARPTEGLVRPNESWKENAGGEVDTSRSRSWSRLSPADQQLGDALAGDLLRELDYPLAGAALERGWLWLHPMHEAAAGDRRLRAELEAGTRLWPAAPGESPRAGFLVGDPDADDWLGRRSGERALGAARILGRVVGLRLRGKRVYWRRSERARQGWSSGLLTLALRPLTVDGGSDG
jgi:hypothetical protein